MKTHLPLRLSLFGLMPALAWAGLPGAPVPVVEPQLLVVPVPSGDAPRSPPSLRDSLRQTVSDDADKPFRLSAEERQHMREQLRSQAFGDRKPK